MTSIGSSDYSSLLKRMSSPADIADRIVGKADGDQNGSLSSAEFAAGLQGVPGMSMSDNSIAKLFGDIDADRDGSLNKEELTSYLDKLADGVRSAMLSAQEEGARASKSEDKKSGSYDALDTNKDGMVSMTERLLGAVNQTDGEAANTGSFLSDMKSALVSRVYQAMGEKTSTALSSASVASTMSTAA
ncbi:hypothetical protein GCM10007276_11300 [Agaricicola taiwanensis]|uniref:EF-hand domain-containing protein n=2 Tax=Agaricicola taiwanensis TaxID=591372 RepID=A0A8J2VPB4_9RHOB|nr:hypothetical protein GCM10007276_11300 [Agaricicola taiwanensis]